MHDPEPWRSKLYRELGLASVQSAGPAAWLIILARSLRMFAYGAVSVFIALFFSSLGFSDFKIGLFMSLTLLGDVILTLILTFAADNVGRRKTLLIGSIMMSVSGLVFWNLENYWVLLFAAVVGIISASGGDFGPFRAIEESILSQLTSGKDRTRSDVLSWYVTTASLGQAIGTEASGRIVGRLKDMDGWDEKRAYHAIFALYVVFGIVNAACVLLLSDRVEAEAIAKEQDAEEIEAEVLLSHQEGDRQNLEQDQPNPPASPPPATSTSLSTSRLAQLSPATRSVMYKLWPLLAVDTLADGMVNLSLTSYYLTSKFQIASSTLGDITSMAFFLAALSTVFAGPLANRLGLINTMVFTHIPSSAAVLLFPLPPNLVITIILFFVRMGLNNMDQAPRAAFIAAVVPASERTAVNGITSTLRTLSSTAGPLITGSLAGQDSFWIAFVTAGVLRLSYDFGLWALFVNFNLHQHE
ncbi:hypothetical protein I317_05035 [Kwoniella heveanensis CBS 569]|uniref:Major facilitator superfamily (MFS) profile domain-containing protein n=1 Tax=Kwoniella heveanensis BCC8398 TaxID=1296120 RepID=A0A1B9GIQ3_9TREE|nr:hypothetical protein I316_07510 [Kwoniella heveanensis BCC8398]OCF41121.1 hypothetical protein I317_05035 [Kwoniella heveanensis CBS 569]